MLQSQIQQYTPTLLSLKNLLNHTYSNLADDFQSYCYTQYSITDLDSLVSFYNEQLDKFLPCPRTLKHNPIYARIYSLTKKLFHMAIHWGLYLCELLDRYTDPYTKSKRLITPYSIVSASLSYVLYAIYKCVRRNMSIVTPYPGIFNEFLYRSLATVEAKLSKLNRLSMDVKFNRHELQFTINNLLNEATRHANYMSEWLDNKNYEDVYTKHPVLAILMTICCGYILAYPPTKKCFLL